MSTDYDYELIDGGSVKIIGYHGSGGDIQIPSELEGLPVTSIGSYAFFDRISLTSVTIPSSVTSIEERAFAQCTSLTAVSIPGSITSVGSHAFFHCTSLASVSIPNSVTYLGDVAFGQCTSLTSITVPDSVLYIGGNPFSACISLNSIDVDADNPNYASMNGVLYDKAITTLIQFPSGRAGSFTVPDSVTYIEDYAFRDCPFLTAINVGESNLNYASLDGVLYDKALTVLIRCPEGKPGDFTIPSSVTAIAPSAFYYCTLLTSVTIPYGVTTIPTEAFYHCTSLTSITMPYGVTSIGYVAFSQCTSLTSIYLPDSVTSIASEAFSICTSLTSVVIPDTVTYLGPMLFQGCSSLTSMVIPESITYIEAWMFWGCSSLTSVTLPSGATSIVQGAFYLCTSLNSITIPSGVATIGAFAFMCCDSMTEMYFQGNAPVCEQEWLYGHNAQLVIYYYFGATGFPPTWEGIPTVCIYPVELSIAPPSNTVESGSTVSYSVSVTNPGTTSMTLGLAIDSTEGSDPRIQLEWFTLSESQIEVEPGATTTLTLSVTVPYSWAAVEDVTTSVLLSVTNVPGTTIYEDELVGLTVKATPLSAIIAVNTATVDIVSSIDLAIVNPTPEAIDNIRTELVELISTIQISIDSGLVSQEEGQGLLASVNAALSSIDRSDSALDEAKMNLLGNALATAQNQLNALMNKLRGIES